MLTSVWTFFLYANCACSATGDVLLRNLFAFASSQVQSQPAESREIQVNLGAMAIRERSVHVSACSAAIHFGTASARLTTKFETPGRPRKSGRPNPITLPNCSTTASRSAVVASKNTGGAQVPILSNGSSR